MATLYLANPTRQQRRVYYRLDMNYDNVKVDKQPPKHIDIAPGRQVRLVFESISQVEIIVGQLNKVGARAVVEKNRLPRFHTVPIVFNVEKPVPPDVIEFVHAHNKMVNHTRSQKHRQAIALAGSQMVQDAVDATMTKFQVDGRVDLRLFEAEIESADRPEGTQGKDIGEGLRVNPKDQGGAPKAKKPLTQAQIDGLAKARATAAANRAKNKTS